MSLPIVVDKSGAMPVYHQIGKQIQELIASGSLHPDEMIPSERDFCKALSISRATVRQAVNILVSDGILYRQKGIGTFVSRPRPKINQHMMSLSNFTQYTLSQGLKPSSQLLAREIVPASLEISSALECALGDAVLMVYRLRLADDVPMALECSYLNLMMCQAVLYADVDNNSLYDILRNDCGVNLNRCRETIELTFCDQESGKHLLVPIGSPVFLSKRITFTETRPVEYVVSQSRSDCYKFTVEMSLKNVPGERL